MDYLINEKDFFDVWSDKLTIPVPTLDIVIFTIYKWNLCMVLWKDNEREWCKNKYAIPWGIIARGFTLEENFDKILERETGITWVYKEQLYTFGDSSRDDRWHTISICYYALVKAEELLKSADFTKIDLIKYESIENYDFIYDHKEILKYAKQRLNWKLEYTNIAKNLLNKEFRISELQNIYEIVLWEKLDKRNFQKKIFKLKMLEDTGKKDKTTNRPAKLYKFKNKELKIYEVL